MAAEKTERKAADVLAGPGLIKRPAALARALDDKLGEMVREMERVANCPTPAFDLPQGLTPASRMERFCEALAGLGEPLFADLVETYVLACKAERFDVADHVEMLEQRGQALIDYFSELAQVHGVAFAAEDAPPPPDAVRRALATLRTTLARDFAEARTRHRV